jgi:hypothetical protein
MAQVTIHHGSYQSIPPTASPGLLFLQAFLPVMDSLDPSPAITPFLTPQTRFLINDTQLLQETLTSMHRMRSERLEVFKHDVSIAWDIQHEHGHTVIFESVSITRFRGDTVDNRVTEMNVWELGSEGGEELKLVEARCCMDPINVQKRAKEFFAPKE